MASVMPPNKGFCFDTYTQFTKCKDLVDKQSDFNLDVETCRV